MSDKNEKTTPTASSAPAFKTDSKLGEAFLSILYDSSTDESGTAKEEKEKTSASLDFLPETDDGIPAVAKPSSKEKKEAADAEDPASGQNKRDSDTARSLKAALGKPHPTEKDAPASAEKEPISSEAETKPVGTESSSAPRHITFKTFSSSIRNARRSPDDLSHPTAAKSDSEPKPSSDMTERKNNEERVEKAAAFEDSSGSKPQNSPPPSRGITSADDIPAAVPDNSEEESENSAFIPNEEEQTIPDEKTLLLTAPFLHGSDMLSTIAADFFIASLPILGARIWHYGWRTVSVLLVSILTCLFSELLFALIARKDPPEALKDCGFVVTALTVTLISSPNLPFWAIAAISSIAVILFRGILGLRSVSVRSHPFNPAMAAFALLLLLDHGLDRIGAIPGIRAPLLLASPDPSAFGVGNPVLASLRAGALPSAPLTSLILGNEAGTIPALLFLISVVYLLVRKTVSWQIPCAMLVSGVLLAALMPRTTITTDMILLQAVLFEICTGSFLVCALFCSADSASVPYTGTGKLLFGLLAGAFTILLRFFTGIVNCAPIGIVAANALTPLINRFTLPRPFGSN